MNTTQSLPNDAWRRTLPLLLAVILWVLFWYRDTAVAMMTIWARSDTYAHAFLVPPISLWLIWRKRRELALLHPEPTFWPALLLAVMGFIWLLGELTAVNALTQFSLVATLIIASVSVLGFDVGRHIAFPLAFLLFAVPIGDFMMPKLMDWTANFTVIALRVTGIPVYQEGLQFIIPSGNWSVVEACSGIRYIIASVTVGTLFAYLNYVSLRRRMLFILAAILVPVVANWLRAYLIVMIGHFSGNRLAVGVDHLIYGWLFFGIVILGMFAVGARWSEDQPGATIAVQPPSRNPASPARSRLIALGLAAITALGPLAFVAISLSDQAAPPQLRPLAPPADWDETSPFSDWKPAYANPSAILQQSFKHEGQAVGLYIAYYRNQDYERKLITSTNTLVISNDPAWAVLARDRVTLATGDVRTADLRGRHAGIETRLVVWHWYWINGHLTTSDIVAKLLTALSRLRGQGDDSAVIMLFAPAEGAAPALAAFAEAAVPQILLLLAQTRDAR